jgi:hypothetical protein
VVYGVDSVIMGDTLLCPIVMSNGGLHGKAKANGHVNLLSWKFRTLGEAHERTASPLRT